MADRPSGRTTSVAEAMDKVLAREREAQEQLESCRKEAEQILADARETARHIQETTQRRISRIHAASNRATAARIRDMRRETSKKTAAIDYEPTQSEAVARAASRLARRLTSRDHDDQ
jgi:vacuolar-type H+-ATPase subunit H